MDLKKEGIESYSKDGLTFKCASEDGDLYYAKKPHEKWKVIILNPYDVSIYRKGREQGLDEEALSLLRKHNPNADKAVRRESRRRANREDERDVSVF